MMSVFINFVRKHKHKQVTYRVIDESEYLVQQSVASLHWLQCRTASSNLK